MANAPTAVVFAIAGLLDCWFARLLVGDILIMETGLAPRNQMPQIQGSSLRRSRPPFPSNLLSLQPSVGGGGGGRN